MVEVEVCVGSSCHIKGSAYVINKLKDEIAKRGLGDKVELRASFCMGTCIDGVCMKVNGESVKGVGPGNIEKIFEEKIASAVE